MYRNLKLTMPVACAAAVMTLGGCSIGNFLGKEKATKTSEFTVPLPELGKCLIRSQKGFIHCVTGEVTEIEVEAEITARAATVEQAETLLEQISIERTETDQGAEIVANIPRGVHGGVSFNVTVPIEMAMNLETSNGSIEVTGVNGNVRCDTSNGSVRVIDCRGPVDVKTSNGKIGLEGESLANIRARTSNGSVQLAGNLEPGSHEIQTSNGSIQVELSGTPVTVIATTSNGSITANGQKLKKGEAITLGPMSESEVASDASIAALSLRTSNGSIRILHSGVDAPVATPSSEQADAL